MITARFLNNQGPLTQKLTMALAFAALSLASVASAQDIRATVDGNLVNFPDVKPVMMNGRVMVPVRGVFEHMNATVDWDNDARSVNAQHGSTSIRLPIDSYKATVNGRQVDLDSPATIYRGRTMVPLRFLSEALGGSVDWIAQSRTVEILTAGSNNNNNDNGYSVMRMDAGTVIPFGLNQQLSSNGSSVGDRFTASLDTDGASNYQGMARGSTLEGHVEVARAKTGDMPGVLGLAFDRIRMADGRTYPIYGSLIGLDSKSVENENGRLTAKPGARDDNLKYVGYGAGGGALLAVLTKGNVINNSLIGAALGFLYGEIQKNPSKSQNVTSAAGTKFGVRLTRDLSFRVMATIPEKH
ncbi:MAG: copper amine oxidase N-terminal domain-containing protein [Armatimonadetes bacterium]|nr:copper amine oxidase N-terminal domain-containing protein [Armatimonadota bacterium]